MDSRIGSSRSLSGCAAVDPADVAVAKEILDAIISGHVEGATQDDEMEEDADMDAEVMPLERGTRRRCDTIPSLSKDDREL